jgi:alkylhydroperoxidase family enzyme
MAHEDGSVSPSPRLAPVARDEWPPEMAQALAALRPPNPRHPVPPPGGRPGRPKASGSLGTFAHHPDLAQAWLTFNGHVLYGTTLTLRHRELLVLRVAVVLRSPYMWAQHLVQVEEAGLTDEDVGRIAFGPSAPFLSTLEQAMLQAVDDLLLDGCISAETWSSLAGTFDERQLLDVVFTVGCYATQAWLFASVGLELEPDVGGAPVS